MGGQYGEPWHVADRGIGWEVHVGPALGEDPTACWKGRGPMCPTVNDEFRDTFSEANARRIVACVNALAGIPTEALESGVVGDMRQCLAALVEALNGRVHSAPAVSALSIARHILKRLEPRP